MSAADVRKRCPNCRGAVPPGKREHAVFCAPRCSKAAHVRGRRFAKRHLLARGKPAGEATVVMHAVRTAFAPGLPFNVADAVEALRYWGEEMDARRLALWFVDLVETDHLTEAPTVKGGKVFWLLGCASDSNEADTALPMPAFEDPVARLTATDSGRYIDDEGREWLLLGEPQLSDVDEADVALDERLVESRPKPPTAREELAEMLRPIRFQNGKLYQLAGPALDLADRPEPSTASTL